MIYYIFVLLLFITFAFFFHLLVLLQSLLHHYYNLQFGNIDYYSFHLLLMVFFIYYPRRRPWAWARPRRRPACRRRGQWSSGLPPRLVGWWRAWARRRQWWKPWARPRRPRRYPRGLPRNPDAAAQGGRSNLPSCSLVGEAARPSLPPLCPWLRRRRRLCVVCESFPAGRRQRGPAAALAHEPAAVLGFTGPGPAAAMWRRWLRGRGLRCRRRWRGRHHSRSKRSCLQDVDEQRGERGPQQGQVEALVAALDPVVICIDAVRPPLQQLTSKTVVEKIL